MQIVIVSSEGAWYLFSIIQQIVMNFIDLKVVMITRVLAKESAGYPLGLLNVRIRFVNPFLGHDLAGHPTD
jgi:hypothetical protein